MVCTSNPDSRFRDKLKNVKEGLKRWSKEKFGKNDQDIETLKNEATKWELLAETRDLGWIEKEKYKNETIKQKARSKWVLEGDENSKFFHSCMRSNNRKSRLNGLMVDGVWCEDPDMIKEKVFEFYSGIFKEANLIRPTLVSNNFKSISSEERDDLEASVEEEEVLRAIKQCGSKKAPGPDGFNFGFLKRFWEIIKVDLMKAIKWFWNTGEISKGCNSSFVTLIPKIQDPITLGDFRPISLVRCYYKIISKILAERMKKVIGKVVGVE